MRQRIKVLVNFIGLVKVEQKISDSRQNDMDFFLEYVPVQNNEQTQYNILSKPIRVQVIVEYW